MTNKKVWRPQCFCVESTNNVIRFCRIRCLDYTSTFVVRVSFFFYWRVRRYEAMLSPLFPRLGKCALRVDWMNLTRNNERWASNTFKWSSGRLAYGSSKKSDSPRLPEQYPCFLFYSTGKDGEIRVHRQLIVRSWVVPLRCTNGVSFMFQFMRT